MSQYRHGFLNNRDAIWASIRIQQKAFSIGDIETATRVEQKAINAYLRGLVIAGYLQRINKQGEPVAEFTKYERGYFNLIKDVGVDAPKITSKGKPALQGQARENMWRTIKIIKQFSIKDLAVHATTEITTVSAAHAKEYLKYLAKAGYIKVLKNSTPKRYQFLPSKYTGPKPPQVLQLKHVYDQNKQHIVWSETL